MDWQHAFLEIDEVLKLAELAPEAASKRFDYVDAHAKSALGSVYEFGHRGVAKGLARAHRLTNRGRPGREVPC